MFFIEDRPKIGLTLGAGAAKGFAHLGVLKVLKEEDIPVDLAAGSSIGSLFAALYALDSDIEILTELASLMKERSYLDLSVPRMGLIKGKKIYNLIKLLTKNKKFEDLEIPLYIVAVDIKRGEEVVFDRGLIADAVRASISIPGIFHPYEINNRLFVDGAVLNRLPVSVVKEKGAEKVIAVDVKLHKNVTIKEKEIRNIFDVLFNSFDLLEHEAAKNHIVEADILISPSLDDINLASFDRAEECIQLGEDAAREKMPVIKNVLNIE